jgi:hypothetical protein
MKTTLKFNITQESSNANAAYQALKDEGLNPVFSPSQHLRSKYLSVEVGFGSKKHTLAKSFLFNADFNKSL